MSIFIDDGKRFQAVDVYPFRSKIFNVGGAGEWAPVLHLVFLLPFWGDFFPRRHRECCFVDLSAIWESFGSRHFLVVCEVLRDGTHS